jgi:hypothetical protein
MRLRVISALALLLAVSLGLTAYLNPANVFHWSFLLALCQ